MLVTNGGVFLGKCSVFNRIPLWCLFFILFFPRKKKEKIKGPWSCLKGTFIALHSVDHVLIIDKCPLVLYDGLYWVCGPSVLGGKHH